jgi:hypothetical protein
VYAHPEADPTQDLEFELRKEEYIRLLLGGNHSATEESIGEEDLSMSIELDQQGAREPLTLSTNTHMPQLEGKGSKIGTSSRQVRSNVTEALQYGGHHFRRLLTAGRTDTITALLTAPVYMPINRLLKSPYGAIFAPYANDPVGTHDSDVDRNAKLVASFSAAYLRAIGLPRDSPLSVVTDIGGGGAMAKIQKVRAVMKEKKTEWSAVGELPVSASQTLG